MALARNDPVQRARYYKEGAYGIRIENLVVVVEREAPQGAERPLHGFETITLAPIDRNLIEPSLLTGEETGWLDAYHRRVQKTHTGAVDEETQRWLEVSCAPLTGR